MCQESLLDQTVAFHGHLCPGLLIGYRAALAALAHLHVERAYDEELVALAETDACGVDAIQFLTGCTLGKGNLILRDWGKQVFSIGRRSDGKMVRVALKYGALDSPEDEHLSDPDRREARKQRLQTLSDEQLFSITDVDRPLPGPARLFKTVACANCGEGVMEARVRLQDGKPLCPQCYGPVYTRCLP